MKCGNSVKLLLARTWKYSWTFRLRASSSYCTLTIDGARYFFTASEYSYLVSIWYLSISSLMTSNTLRFSRWSAGSGPRLPIQLWVQMRSRTKGFFYSKNSVGMCAIHTSRVLSNGEGYLLTQINKSTYWNINFRR